MSRPLTIASLALAATLIAGIAATGQVHPFRDTPYRTDAVATKARISMMGSLTLPRLRGYVGGDNSITISKHKVPRGRYRIVVIDDSSHHNWHITGPYVDKETTVQGMGKWVWRIRLRKGTYSIVCDPHKSSMYTYLKVTAG